jgi:hypothetical protein
MLLRRDQEHSQITDVAFSLRPGELSQVFASLEGYHILVRPRLEEVRGPFADLLAEEELAGIESVYVEALAVEMGLEVLPDAAQTLRRVAADPFAELENPRALAEFYGGQLTAGQAARYLHLLSEEIRPELREGPDWGLEDFARQLALQELLWVHVEDEGFGLSDPAFAAIRARYLSQLDSIWGALEIVPDSLTGPDASHEERERSAIRKLDLYMELVLGRVKPVQRLPAFLAVHLLQGVNWEVNPEGIEEAISAAAHLLDLAGYENPG